MPVDSNEITLIQNEVSALMEQAAGFANIKTLEDEASATEFVSQIKKRNRAIEKKMKQYVDPLKDTIKTIQADFKPFIEELDQAEDSIRKGMIAFRNAEDFRVREEARKRAEIEAKAAVNEMKNDMTPESVGTAIEAGKKLEEAKIEAPKKVETASGSVHYRKDWYCEIVDPYAVPGEFTMPDMAKIKAAVKAGTRTIEGVRIWEESRPVIGA